MSTLETTADSTDNITTALRHEILAGELAPGDRLLEIPLSEKYGCGRAAIRSAIVALSAEGLVVREPNRGARVRRISLDEAVQITEARAALEALIAADAARNANDDDRAALQRIIEEMRDAVNTDNGADYSDLNRRLHRRLREISGHTVAAELVENLRNRAAHHQFRLAAMPGRSATSLEQHAAIVDAIVRSAPDDAAAAMAAHLGSVGDVLRAWSTNEQARRSEAPDRS